MIVTDDTGQLKAWIEKQIRDTCPQDFKSCQTLGVARNGEVICGVAYWFYPTGICDVGIAATSPRWATKQTIFTLFAYPFNQVGVNRLQSFIHPKNKRSRKLCAGLGFKLEGRLRKFHRGADMLIYGYTKEDFQRSKWCE
tara:strand:- start:226 stop:645 length:420 start_codon:yes stop_codon:yes gene_type:complete